MSVFGSLDHLQKQLGEELFAMLISSDNTDKVKAFCTQLAKVSLTEMRVGLRFFDILSLLQGDEKHVDSDKMVDRAKKLNATNSKDDASYLLKYQADIPVELRGKVAFVFTNWHYPGDPKCFYFVYWNGCSWVSRAAIDGSWNRGCHVLRPK